ncbi:MAG: zf-HC2 domain-containing protein, partial [Myxococcales bacterium]|nr:zf-HC2 domain-containing protein [Myxococcales bacterium]
MSDQQTIGGLTCGEVLELLPDFLEGSISTEQRASIEEHLAGCDWCERFGGEYGAV